ncbi:MULTISPECIES: hypothetical protein [unclassified Phormidium]|nr:MULTISPECIES: hypothetical protein [unclassified Phormidium]MBD1914279.1 hypothetical protein [Phormidium sp. FACHB-77]MBD2031214.1 hypothetical protein [Phormidium sp. FACHB-322]
MITVGTRQVGWRCRDGVVRSLGADGVKYDPQHTAELYQNELDLKRNNHQDKGNDHTYPWSVWDLGYRLWQQCQQADFGPVELLLDEVIIADQIPKSLSHVILWGTQQPDTVSWHYRRMDTAWLAELMAGKLKQKYPELQVKVFRPLLSAIDTEAIRDELESHILPFALQTRLPNDSDFTLLIENKGATPAIAEGLSICAGALVRDCQVVTTTPTEPRPLYPRVSDTVQTVAPANEYRRVNLSSYFWPLERSRILSAWQRGDFREAQVWLQAHRPQHRPMYELAGYLALTTNWQMDDALKGIKNWVGTRNVKNCTTSEIREIWQAAVSIMCPAGGKQTSTSKYLKIWETRLLMELELSCENYTAAFMQFAQTLERLLFWRYETENWIQQRLITPPEDKKVYGLKYKASLGELKIAWLESQQIEPDSFSWQQLDAINELRNSVIHRSTSLTPEELQNEIWPHIDQPTPEALYKAMISLLQTLLPPDHLMPDRSLLQDLYSWGIEQLQA